MPDITQTGPSSFFVNPPITPQGQGGIIPDMVPEAQAGETLPPLSNFNVQMAIKDGIAPNVIAEHLSEQAGFNYNAARKDNVTDAQIIEHLTGQNITVPQIKAPAVPFTDKITNAVAQAIPTEYFTQPLGQKILELPKAAVETGLAMGTGVLGMLPAETAYGLRKSYGQLTGDPLAQQKADEMKQVVSQALTYQPTSPTAQAAMGIMGAPFQAAGEQVKQYTGQTGQDAFNAVLAALPYKGFIPKATPGAASMPKPGAWTPEQAKLYQTATQNKLPVSPESIRSTRPARVINDVISDVPLINRLTQSYRQKVVDVVNKSIEDIRGKFASPEAIDAMDANVETLYSNAFNNIKSPTIPIRGVLEYLKALEDKGALTKQGKGILADIQQQAGFKKEIPADRLPLLKKQISTIGKGDIKRTINSKLLEAISEVEGGGTATKALMEIDKAYMYQMKSKRINNLINMSYDRDGYFNPDMFLNKYKTLRNDLKRQVPEAATALDNFADIVDVSSKDIKAYNKFDKNSTLWGSAGVVTGAGSLIASPQTAIPAGIGLSMLTKSTMNPEGWMKQFLLRGEKPGIGRTPPNLKSPLRNEMGAIGGANKPSLNLSKPLRETKVPVPDSTFEMLGVKKGNVFADYEALWNKHKDQFKDTYEVQGHVEYVMEAPEYNLPASHPTYRMLVRRNGGDKATVIEFELKGGKYRVISAYKMWEGQLERKIEKAQHAVSEPIPGSSPETGNLGKGRGVPSDTLHVEPSDVSIAKKTNSVNRGRK